jgi:hypothetical protein
MRMHPDTPYLVTMAPKEQYRQALVVLVAVVLAHNKNEAAGLFRTLDKMPEKWERYYLPPKAQLLRHGEMLEL